MQIIILNSGIGTRLLPYTQSKPKCLLRIDGKNILEYQIESLIKANLNGIIITTGLKLRILFQNVFHSLK